MNFRKTFTERYVVKIVLDAIAADLKAHENKERLEKSIGKILTYFAEKNNRSVEEIKILKNGKTYMVEIHIM